MKYPEGAIALIPVDVFCDGLNKMIIESIQKTIRISIANPGNQNKPAKQEELLNRKQLAELLNVSLPTISKYMKEGKIKYCRLGKKILFNKHEILESIKYNLNEK